MASFDQVEQLERELLEKEQLIAALTISLEQAANELDRAHRHPVIGPFLSDDDEETEPAPPDDPAELSRQIHEQQLMLLEIREGIRYLHHHPQPPSESPPDPALTRIECQLDEIRDLIESLAQSQPSSAVLPTDWKASLTEQMSRLKDNPIAELIGLSLDSSPPTEFPRGNPARGEEDSESTSQEDSEVIPSASESEATEIVRPYVDESKSSKAPDPKLLEMLPELPEAVDLATEDLETLRAAVAVRDECIQAMQDYIVALNTASIPEFDLKDYDALPEAQRQKLESWEAVIRENLRRTEVEISVERARMAREQQKLQFQQLQLAKERKRMGMQGNHSPAQEHQDARNKHPRATQSSRTWLSLFHRHEPTSDDKSEEDHADSEA